MKNKEISQTKPRNNISDDSISSIPVEPQQIDLSKILNKLQHLSEECPGKRVDLTEEEINGIVRTVKEIFRKQEALLELNAPINVCGDIHGQYYDLLRIFAYGGFPPNSSYLFLGDYVDRGEYGIQTICLLFALKIKYQNKIFLLRGNHETESITKMYGFYNECKKRYNIKLWKTFLSCFAELPIAAVIEGRIICMHGGLSPHMLDVKDIKRIERPTEVPQQGLLCDLLWADPTTETTGWASSQRGCSYVFGCDVSNLFLKGNDLDLVCRAHQVVEDGYQFCHKKKVVTLFSAPNYCKQFENSGAFMKIDANLRCQFHILRPSHLRKPLKNSKPKATENIVVQ